MKKKIFAGVCAVVVVLNVIFAAVMASGIDSFELISAGKSSALGGMIYRYKHIKTGAEVVYNDNGAEKREFALGFKTPPADSRGANHVLEHALFCGSEKYPTKNIMHYIQNGTSSLMLNGVTADDCTYYLINSSNETEYYNMMDVYMNGIFHPLFLKDENIFRQQGIRIEYADGKARYNGVVYNELRIKNLNTEENSVNFLSDKLYRAIYGDTAPSHSAGGELKDIKHLTYEDLLRVYNKFYIPSNSMTYLAGKQDIDKTLSVLDTFFSENDKKAPDISFEDTKQIPSEKIQKYNIDENTETVDIGFMSSGVPASADPKDRYANEIVFDIIKNKMEEETGYTNTYISGGNTGGISTLALMISEVPIEKQNEVIDAYNKVLADLADNGIDEQAIDTFINDDNRYFYQNFDRVFIGLFYKDNPLAYTEIDFMRDYYKSNKEYFTEILKRYFTENPCSVIVISGNGIFSSEDSTVDVSAEELEKIRRETEEFQKWNDMEDDPEVIDKIPFLTLDEVKNPPEKSEPQYEEKDAIAFYHTLKEETSASMYFPLDIKDEDLDYVQLMRYFLISQAEKTDADFYTMIAPLGDVHNINEINPHFLIGLLGNDVSESLRRVIAFLQADNTWNEDDLAQYIRTTPKQILNSYYDPYFLSSELKGSALSAEGRLGYLTPLNTIVKGSPHYYDFLRGLNVDDASEIAERIKTLAEDIVVNNKPVVGYIGDNSGYEAYKNTVLELFAEADKRVSMDMKLPAGCYSAATITKLADANHFMLTAPYSGDEYSGKLAVLGKVLLTKYITPTMRGRHGAYGCSISFRDDGMVSAVTGLADIDFALEIWEGMGDYLRNLNMTQKELDSFIVSAVQEYDEWDYTASEYGAEFALRKKTPEDCERIRSEMLLTTVEDIKDYADLIDSFVKQMRVFAVLGMEAADSAKFDFAYYGNADTLEVTPRLTKNPVEYMRGRSDGLLALDDNVTRAEAAQMISCIIADRSVTQNDIAFSDVPAGAWYYDAVMSLCGKGIISGYEDNSFKPDKNMTRAELSAVLARFIYDGNTELRAVDVDKNAWYADAMAKMINAGYINGYEDGTIKPDKPITRGEASAIIDRMLSK